MELNVDSLSESASPTSASGSGRAQPTAGTSSANAGGPESPQAGKDKDKDKPARPFRSRKQRPCDSCRRQKNRCAITTVGEPCVECKQTGKPCTFLAPVPERKPSTRPASSTLPRSPPDPVVATLSGFLLPDLPTIPSEEALETLATAAWNDGRSSTKRARSHESGGGMGRAGLAPPGRMFSLEHECPQSTEPCAITSMLTDDLLPVRSLALTGQGEETLGHRQVAMDATTPQFFTLLRKPAHRAQTADFERSVLRRVRTSLAILPQPFDEQSAISLYSVSSHTAFPILPLTPNPSLDSLPPALLALVLATSLDHSPHTNHASKPVWENIKEDRVGESMLEQPKLAGIATALLELGARPVLDERGDYLLLAKAIAQAQLLGLHINSEGWALPEWERSLRLRLWWCLRIHDAWSSFLNSRPSHLQQGNTSVPLPTPSCIDTPGDIITLNRGVAFHYLCRLAVQVSRFQNDLFTIEKLRLAKGGHPTVLRSVEKELAALESESRHLVGGQLQAAPAGAYCFRFMLLGFKCMVRRVAIELSVGIGGAFLPDADTLSLFSDLVDFVANLPTEAFSGFWLPYSCHVLSSTVSSLIRLALASISSGPTDSTPAITVHAGATHQPVHLLSRLCIVLSSARALHRWDVCEWALMRAKNVANRLRGVAGQSNDAADDYRAIVTALEGQYVEAPLQPPLTGNVTGPGELGGADSVLPGDAFANVNGAEIMWNVDSHGLPDLDEWLNALDGGGPWAMEPPSNGYLAEAVADSAVGGFSSW